MKIGEDKLWVEEMIRWREVFRGRIEWIDSQLEEYERRNKK